MLDQARSLMQEIDDFAKEKDMIEYNHELNLLESRVVELKDMRDETDRAWVRYMNAFWSMGTKLPRNIKYRKTNERKSIFETFFCRIQVTEIRQRDSLQIKKSFDTPILALFHDEC